MTHPITPPPELVEQWSVSSPIQHSDESWAYELFIAHRAARWGADEELNECCEFLLLWYDGRAAVELVNKRRPKPPSLKEQALIALHAVATEANDTREQHQDLDTIRKALEALP